jgi:OOP family OmpA-OmpF porin
MRNKIAVMAAMSMLTSSVMAAESGWYIGANAGTSKVDIDKSDFDSSFVYAFNSSGFAVVSASSTLDDTDTTWSLDVGYKFSPNFALEVGYADLGAATYRASGTLRPFFSSFTFPANLSEEISVKGPQLAAIGILPLGKRFDLHAKVGAFFAKTTDKGSITIQGNNGSGSVGAHSTEAFFGLGAGFNITDRLVLNLNWQIYKNVGDEEKTGEADVKQLTAGLALGF